MNQHNFPMIWSLDQVRPAIENHPEFQIMEKDGYFVVNYHVVGPDSFPPITGPISESDENLHRAVRRECRGMLFDMNGKIIRRPLHKFKNVNEAEDTQLHVLDFSLPHYIETKLDGSLISPFMLDGEVRFGTKQGITEVSLPAEKFAKSCGVVAFSAFLIELGYTPCFEWTSRKQRIVIDYPEDCLTLLAVRNMYTGEYLDIQSGWIRDHAEHYNVPIVEQHGSVEDPKKFMEYVHDLKGAEGFVIRWDDGQRVKVKAHEYLTVHRALEAITQDRHIVAMILDNILDDIKATLHEERRKELEEFEGKIISHLVRVSREFHAQIVNFTETLGLDRKQFAIQHAPHISNYLRAITFSCWEDHSSEKVYDEVVKVVRKHLTRNVEYDKICEEFFEGEKFNA